MMFVLARIPVLFGAGCMSWWIARTVRPITDLIPGLHSFFDPKFIPDIDFFLPFSLWAGVAFVSIFALFGGLRFSESFEWSREVSRIFVTAVVWGMAIISYFSLVQHKAIFSRMMLAQALFFAVTLSMCFLFFLRKEQEWFWKRKMGTTNILLVGTKNMREKIKRILQKYPEFSVAGEITVSQLSRIATPFLQTIHEIWYVDSGLLSENEKKLREFCYEHHKVFRFLPESLGSFAKMDLQIFGGIPILRPIPAALSGWGRIAKRVFDIIFSSIALAFLSPLFLIIALAITWEGRWHSPPIRGRRGREERSKKKKNNSPVFYCSKRIGRNGVPFFLWKFRSMVVDADARKKELMKKNHRADSPFFKVKNDPRVTKVGKVLRRFSLDELPQLWNVLRGDMSLIGPRPHLPEEVKQLTPELKRTLSIRPGISGLAQVSGRSDLSFAEEMRLDTYYVENWTMWLDVKIFFKTIWVVLKGEGAD